MINFDSTETHIKQMAIEPRNDINKIWMKAKYAALTHVTVCMGATWIAITRNTPYLSKVYLNQVSSRELFNGCLGLMYIYLR